MAAMIPNMVKAANAPPLVDCKEIDHKDSAAATLNVLSPKFAVGQSPLHGRGLFATETIPAGTTIYRERPLVAMQTLANRRDVLVCAACFGPCTASTRDGLPEGREEEGAE